MNFPVLLPNLPLPPDPYWVDKQFDKLRCASESPEELGKDIEAPIHWSKWDKVQVFAMSPSFPGYSDATKVGKRPLYIMNVFCEVAEISHSILGGSFIKDKSGWSPSCLSKIDLRAWGFPRGVTPSHLWYRALSCKKELQQAVRVDWNSLCTQTFSQMELTLPWPNSKNFL